MGESFALKFTSEPSERYDAIVSCSISRGAFLDNEGKFERWTCGRSSKGLYESLYGEGRRLYTGEWIIKAGKRGKLYAKRERLR